MDNPKNLDYIELEYTLGARGSEEVLEMRFKDTGDLFLVFLPHEMITIYTLLHSWMNNDGTPSDNN